MRAIYFIASIPRYILTKVLGTLDKRFFWSALSCLQYGEIPEPSLPSQEWVKIKTIYGGICGSDLGVITLHSSPVLSAVSSPKFVLGHENVGIVVEGGKEVREFEPGQRVVVDPTLSCEVRGFLDRCPMCREGRENLCYRVTEGNIAPGLLMGSCQDTGGSWGEYFVAHRSRVYLVPEEITDEEAVMVEPLAVALHAAWNNFPKDTDTVLIIGGGTIGLCTVAALRALGSKARIVLLYKYPFQADLARSYGADALVKLGQEEELAQAIGAKPLKPLMGGPISLSGPAVTFDCVGSRASIELALRFTGAGGKVVLVGLASIPSGIDWTPIWLKELKVVGTYSYAVEDYKGEKMHTFQLALGFMARKEVELRPLVTHKFRVDEYRKALEWVAGKGRKGLVKAVFDFTPQLSK